MRLWVNISPSLDRLIKGLSMTSSGKLVWKHTHKQMIWAGRRAKEVHFATRRFGDLDYFSGRLLCSGSHSPRV